jgi:hypothetical protein
MEEPLFTVVQSRTGDDCAIVALATYLGYTYEDVLAVAAVVALDPHRDGLYIPQIRKCASIMGTPLSRRRKWSYEADNGVLSLSGVHEHVAVLYKGLVFDSNGDVWSPKPYLRRYHYTAECLLQRRS